MKSKAIETKTHSTTRPRYTSKRGSRFVNARVIPNDSHRRILLKISAFYLKGVLLDYPG